MLSDIRRLQPGERVTTESFNALVETVQMLRRIATSFPLEAHRSPAGIQISLATQPRWELMELDENIESFDKDKSAKHLRYKPEEEEDKWSLLESGTKSLSDAQACTYLAGERRLCFFHPGAGRYVPIDAFQWHIGLLDEDIESNSSATVSVWQMSETGSFSDTDLDIVAYDWLLPTGKKLKSGTRVVVQFLIHARKWLITQAGDCAE
ncbi:MAG: hypothetical protein K8U03_06625 [Planctomycetia bacterium]|nr:hypothetical protein [Planctomycetia bacterium]